MTQRATYRLAASLILFFVTGSASKASPLAYEGFGYPPVTILPKMCLGTGWLGCWVGSSAMINLPPTLSYPTALPSTGDALLNPTAGEAFRTFSLPLNNFGSDLWISFQEESLIPGGDAFVDLFPVGSFPNINVNKITSGPITLNGAFAGPASGVGQVDFFVLQLSQFSGSTVANLFVDPGPGALLGPPSASIVIPQPFVVSQFYYRSDPGQLLDEIRVGTTAFDVAAAVAAVPEPGTMLLLGLGLAFAGIRRQRV
jgi:hypothetical protein